MKKGMMFYLGMAIVFAICLSVPVFGSGQSGSSGTAGSGSISSNLNLTGLPILKVKETFSIAFQRNALSANKEQFKNNMDK